MREKYTELTEKKVLFTITDKLLGTGLGCFR